MPITVLHVPADLAEPVRKLRIEPTGQVFHELVGGYLEAVSIWSGRVMMYADEEGLLKRRPHNRRASDLKFNGTPTRKPEKPGDYWKVRRGLYDLLVGDVVIFGGADDEGNAVGLTDLQVTQTALTMHVKPDDIVEATNGS